MILINDTTALVFDTDDLREAVDSDNGIDYVYFGADITLGYGITIYPGKPSLTFDGTYEGVKYTFTDMNNLSSSNTIGIRSVSNIIITFKNINLIGRNYYGIPYVPNGSIYNGISTIYENVTYSGIQINHNPYGFTRFTDCNITVSNHEVAEVSRLELDGVTTIVKTVAANAVFWLYGTSSQRPYMRVLAGANVSITTANYFMYEYNPPDFIIEPGASLSVNSNLGVGYDSGNSRVNSFLVDENASFRFIQAVSGGIPSLFLNGPLTVNEGASFYMQANFSNTSRLIRFTGSSGGLYINNPKSFVLYNRGNTSATAFQFVSQIPIVLSGGQVNHWDDATQFPQAGTLEDRPQSKWKRPDYTRFTLQGTASNSGTVIDSHDFTPEELAELPPLEDLQLATAMVLSIGQIPLTVYSTVIERGVTGLTEPYANVKLMFMPSYYEDPQTVVAGENGLFDVIPEMPVPFSDYVEVFSNTPFLIVSVVKIVRASDELYIERAPIYINFPVRPMADFEDKILPREDPEETVLIVDTRMPRSQWDLWVNISGPLATDENDILDDAVVFCFEDGQIETVKTTFMPIHTGEHLLDNELQVGWAENRGILARITVPIRSGKRYTTRLGWVVTPAGVTPEELE